MRFGRVLAAICASALAVCWQQVCAETLARLTVTSFTLGADTKTPQVEVPFHVIVTLHVRERVSQIDNLNLPVLADVELLGDERHWQSEANGTSYRETIAVVAHHTGTIHLAAATLDCIDARDGKPKRFSTNGLDLVVGGNPLEPIDTARSALVTLFRVVLWIVLSVGGIACALLVVVLLFRRRRVQPVVAALSPAAPEPIPARTRADDVRDAYLTLRAERSRTAALRARAVVWRLFDAGGRDTLSDVLKHPQAQEPAMREVLYALERAAFTHDEGVDGAIEDAIAALGRIVA